MIVDKKTLNKQKTAGESLWEIGGEMNNIYSITILITLTILSTMGGYMGYQGNYWGFIPFVVGVYMISGFKILKASPRELGVITFLGKKTDSIVEGLTLLFRPFDLEIVGIVIVDAQMHTINLERVQIRCSDGGLVEGTVTIGIRVRGDKLQKYDNAGGQEGVKKQLRGIVEVCLQKIAREKDTDFFITQSVLLGEKLKKRMDGQVDEGEEEDGILDDASGLGIIIEKLQIDFNMDKKLVEAEQKRLIGKVVQKRISDRLKFYKDQLGEASPEIPSLAKIRAEVNEDTMIDKDLIREVRSTGGIITLADSPQTRGTK